MKKDMVLQRLSKLYGQSRLPPSLIFLNPNHTFVEGTIVELSRALLCSEIQEGACGTCSSCKKFNSSNHPDFRVFDTEKKELSIDEIKALISWLQVRPHESSVKIAALPNAQKFNTSSGNSLLKTLEEPPSHGLMLLGAGSSAQILPTLSSRLFKIRISESAQQESVENYSWEDDLVKILNLKSKASFKQIFDFTLSISKQKEQLPRFFEILQDTLSQELQQPIDFQTFHKLENTFQECLHAENQLLRRYGNTALWLDDILLRWKSSFVSKI